MTGRMLQGRSGGEGAGRGWRRLAPALGTFLAVLLMGVPLAKAQPSISDMSVPQLVDALEHPNPVVRAEAADELGLRKSRKALLPLILALADSSANVRAHAVEALRQLGDERAVPYVARLLGDPDPTVRCRAVLALGTLGGDYVIPTVTRELSDSACIVRAAAIRALGTLGDPLSIDDVLAAQKAEKQDVDDAVTASAILSAAELGGKEGLARSLDIAGRKIEHSWLVRAVVAQAIGVAKATKRIPLLVSYLGEDPDPRVCQAAAAALARLGQRRALAKALGSEQAFRRKAAVAGLARETGPEVTSELVKATGDSAPSVVLEAGAALLARGEVDALPVVYGLLSEDGPIWIGAVTVLERRTGLNFGRDPVAWKTWFDRNRAHLVFDVGRGRFEVRR